MEHEGIDYFVGECMFLVKENSDEKGIGALEET